MELLQDVKKDEIKLKFYDLTKGRITFRYMADPEGNVIPPEMYNQLAERLQKSRAGRVSPIEALLAQQLDPSRTGQ
jgi:hypothetical protein